MRNLKRALSLALAAAMLIGMMVVGASAAEYGDNNSIANQEAVEVLSDLGVIGGDQNGNYNPTATLTRAEFCVMIANVLTGGKFDKALFEGANTPFTDINGHWGQAYIAYCYSSGVIAGTSATTFSPDNTLTAAQASAILLSALGYNQNGEFGLNGQFELNVTKWAQQAGLYDNLSVSAVAGISRDNTAQLIFNALVNTTPVGYSSLAEAYYTIGESALSGVVYSGKDLDPDDPTGVYGRTLGYTNFGLEYGVGSSDSFERPAHRWISDNNTDIGTYADGAALTYTSKPSESALKSALNGYTFDANVEVNEDGNADSATTTTLKTNTAIDDTDIKALRDLMGNGVLVEIFANRANQITDVVIINSYLATVTSDYDEDEENVEIATGAGETYTLELDDFAGIVNYREDDKLVITVSDVGETSAAVRSVAPATVVEDVEVTAYGSDNVTAAGTKYNYNAAADTANDFVTGYDLSSEDTTYTLYLDTYGYVLGSEGYEVGANYVYISAYDYNDSAVNKGNPYTAKAYFTDGSTQVIDVKNEGAVKSGWGTTNDDDVNTWYTYTKNSSDVYTLNAVDNSSFTNKAEVNSANALLATGVRANSSTVFIFLNDKGDVTSTVTGIRNVDFEQADGYIVVKDGAAKAVVVTDYKGAKTAGEYIYILGAYTTTNYDRTNEVNFYTYDAIVNGEKTTVNALSDTMTVGLYDAEYEYDGQYLTDTLTQITSNTGIEDEVVFIGSLGTTGYSDGTLTLTATDAFVLADNYSLLTVDDKTVTSRTPARLVNLTTGDGDFAGVPAIVLLNEDGEATCVIVSAGIESDAVDAADQAKENVSDALEENDWRGHTPVGDFEINGTTITVKYDSSNIVDGLTNDLPRLLGEFYDQGIQTIVYNGVTYKWNTSGSLAGSNWTVNGENSTNTLVKAIGNALEDAFDITDPTQAAKGATFSFNMTLDGVEFTYTGTYTGVGE